MAPEPPTPWLDFRVIVTLAVLSAAAIVTGIVIYLRLLPRSRED